MDAQFQAHLVKMISDLIDGRGGELNGESCAVEVVELCGGTVFFDVTEDDGMSYELALTVAAASDVE